LATMAVDCERNGRHGWSSKAFSGPMNLGTKQEHCKG
jgi:hypothetical protein